MSMTRKNTVVTPSDQESRSKSNRQDGRVLALIFTLPAVVLVIGLMYYPMIQTFIESLYTSSFLSPEPEYVGLETYQDMFADEDFWQIVRNSIVWTLAVVLLQNIIGLGVATLVNVSLPTRGIMRALVLLPWVLPGIVGAILWRFMYDPQLGLINSLLLSWNITDERIGWLAEPSTAMGAVIIAAVWKGFPFSAIIYLAGLQGVDHEKIEAAQIDGANLWQRFRHIVIPSMAGIIRLNLLLTTIWTFNYFDMIWITTGGGPLDSTHIFPTMIYELGFGQFQFGEASAYGTIAVLILVVFALLYLNELRTRLSER